MSNLTNVPNDLFSSLQVFKSTLKDCWDSLSDDKKEEITHRLLPSSIPSNERCNTVNQLLASQLKHFETDLLESAFFQLKISKLAPDIGRTLEDVRKLNAKACRLKEKENQLLLWTEVIARRRRLFKDSLACTPHDSIQSYDKKKLNKDPYLNGVVEKRCDIIPGYIGQMVSKRYHRELKDLHGLAGKKTPVISSDEEDLQSTSHPSTDHLDILFSENIEANSMPLLLKQQTFNPIKSCSKLTDGSYDSYSEYRYRILMKQHKRKKKLLKLNSTASADAATASQCNETNLEDIIARAKGLTDDSILLVSAPSLKHCPPVKRLKKVKGSVDSSSCQTEKEVTSTGLEVLSRKLNLNLESVKKESVFDFIEDLPSDSQSVRSVNAQAVPNSSGSSSQPAVTNVRQTSTPVIPASVVNPSSAPALATTVSISPSVASKSRPAQATVVYEKAPASFFSLIRDIFRTHAPNDQKLTLHKLEELAKDKLRSINPNLGWNHESVQSAMNFLSYYAEPDASGENVPLVDYKEKNQQWQWIGTGRDSDAVLIPMCKEWTAEKDRNSSVIDPSQPIPPSICPTEWTVQPSTDDERKSYRDQEAVRYRNPQRAFTYRVHSYESVVGPVKGCGNAVATAAPAASPNKAREHSLLVSDRPPFVTLLSLVRDAAARLPNGEGTRADICELLKDSQYLLPSVSDQQINSIVSGALDRLHYEKDPCVKYDVNRKVWIYLHRNRSEGDFERLHEMQVAAAKAKRNLSKRTKPTASTKVVTSIVTTVTATQSPAVASPPASISVKPITLHNSNQFKLTASSTSITPVKTIEASPLPSIQGSDVTHKLTVTPLAPKTSSHLQMHSTSATVTDSTDQNILNILNQAQGTTKTIFKQNSSNNGKDASDTMIPVSICTGLSTSAATMSPVVSVPSSVVSMIPVVSLPQVAKVFNTSEGITSSGIMSRLLQSSSQTKSLIKSTPSKTSVTSNDLKKLTLCQTAATASTTNKIKVQSPVQPIVRHVQQNQTQTISIQSPGQQLTVPSSLLIGARSGQVVLATGAGGKSYMMTTAPTPGSIVIQQNSASGQPSLNQATLAQASSGLRVQNIKVISMPSNSPRLIVPQHPGQVVARIITRPSAPGNNNQQNPIVMTPNASFQPLLLTSAALPISTSNVSVQSTSSLVQSTVQTHQITSSQLTTVPIVISKQQTNVQ